MCVTAHAFVGSLGRSGCNGLAAGLPEDRNAGACGVCAHRPPDLPVGQAMDGSESIGAAESCAHRKDRGSSRRHSEGALGLPDASRCRRSCYGQAQRRRLSTRPLTCVAAGGEAMERAEALATLVSTARLYWVHRSRTPAVSRTGRFRLHREAARSMPVSTLASPWLRRFSVGYALGSIALRISSSHGAAGSVLRPCPILRLPCRLRPSWRASA